MFHLLHTFSPSPIFLSIGPVFVRWYGVLLAFGALLGFLLFYQRGRKQGVSEDDLTSLALYVVIAGFLGARLYHVLNEPSYYWHNPTHIVQVWRGGLAIHGALLAGFVTIWWYCRKHQRIVLQITDLLAPALVVGQAVGRWGNYFNQELFGRPTNLPWGIPIDPANRPEGFAATMYFHPTFLYESLWDFATLGVLLLLAQKKQMPYGVVTAVYIGLAAIGRLATEFLRIDRVPHIFGVRLPLLVSIVLLIGAVGGCSILIRKKKMNGVRPNALSSSQ